MKLREWLVIHSKDKYKYVMYESHERRYDTKKIVNLKSQENLLTKQFIHGIIDYILIVTLLKWKIMKYKR